MSEGWICLYINIQYLSSFDSLEIRRRLFGIFGESFIDSLLIRDNQGSIDNYIFVKCIDYFSHIEKLKESSFVFNVLESFENPKFISEKEIETFGKSLGKKELDILVAGDIVKATETYLNGLYGIVIKNYGNDAYLVKFKFYVKDIFEKLDRKSLDFCGTVLDKKD